MEGRNDLKIHSFIRSLIHLTMKARLCVLCRLPAQLTTALHTGLGGPDWEDPGTLFLMQKPTSVSLYSCESIPVQSSSLQLTFIHTLGIQLLPILLPIVNFSCRIFSSQQLFGDSQTKPAHFQNESRIES